jgi:hypothetical protein
MLLAVDTIWAGITLARGIQVGFWGRAQRDPRRRWEWGKRDTLRPAIICAVAVAITTSASYLAMTGFHFSR